MGWETKANTKFSRRVHIWKSLHTWTERTGVNRFEFYIEPGNLILTAWSGIRGREDPGSEKILIHWYYYTDNDNEINSIVAMINFRSVTMSYEHAVLSSRSPSQESPNNSTCIILRSLPLPYLKMEKFWWREQPPGRYFFSNIPSGNHNQQNDQFHIVSF